MYENTEKQSKLDKIESKLYSRKPFISSSEERTNFESQEIGGEVDSSWNIDNSNRFDELASKVSMVAERKKNFVKKIFISSLIFFFIASIFAAFVFLGGSNLVSSKNVDIKVVGPVSVGGGRESSFDVNIINNNNIDLEGVSLTLEFPDGTRDPKDISNDLKRERFAIGTIRKGNNYNQKISAVFFGEKESVKQVKISLEYRVENSSAIFYKEKSYEFFISSSPVIITPTYPKEVNSNQEINLDIEIFSNTAEGVKDLLVQVEYPFGFVYKSSSLDPIQGSNNTWKFSEIKSGGKRNISIQGTIIGQDNEEKVFRISSGTASKDDERIIAVPITQSLESVLIKKPFIGLDLFIENREGDYPAKGGSRVSSKISIRNNLSERLFNVFVEVHLSGGALDQSSVFAGDNGFFRSVDNVIFWDNRSVTAFSGMEPGSVQDLFFRLTPLVYSMVPKGTSPSINILVKVKGERISDNGSVESISATEESRIVLSSDLSLSSYVVRSLGNIENYGPIPPKVNIPTTYTIVWSLKNSFNQISGAEVKAKLPSYVKWTGLTSPKSENIFYDENTNEVVWNAGTVLPGTGFDSSPKEIYFQLEITPSVSQVSTSPVILSESYLSATDKVTGVKIQDVVSSVTTSFYTDSTFRNGDDRVVH